MKETVISREITGKLRFIYSVSTKEPIVPLVLNFLLPFTFPFPWAVQTWILHFYIFVRLDSVQHRSNSFVVQHPSNSFVVHAARVQRFGTSKHKDCLPIQFPWPAWSGCIKLCRFSMLELEIVISHHLMDHFRGYRMSSVQLCRLSR